jgi:hypothetical protein
MKVYLKRGAPNYKEKRLISAIEKAVEERLQKDSSFASNFKPAMDFDELKKLHDELCIETTDFVEVKNEEEKHKEFRDGMKNSVEPVKESSPNSDVNDSFIDPFNDAEPIVRDYVTEGGFKEAGSENVQPKTTFEEPTSFSESFDMPTQEQEKGGAGSKATPRKDKKVPDAPINPKFDDMDNGKKKRSTKKFARLIIEGVCVLAEKGCIWWTTKDITEDKLLEYQIEDTMDLNILLTLENNQKQPVIEWFRSKVKDANELFKVSKEDKDDLVDSLYEVMLEKGVAPTPMQELIINAVKTFVLDMGLKAFALSSEIKNVLSQLTNMHKETKSFNQSFDADVDSVENTENPAMQDDEPVAQPENNNIETALAIVE